MERTVFQSPIRPTANTHVVRVPFVARFPATRSQTTRGGVGVEVRRPFGAHVLLEVRSWVIPNRVIKLQLDSQGTSVKRGYDAFAAHDGIGKAGSDIRRFCEVPRSKHAACPAFSGLLTPASAVVDMTLTVNAAFRVLEERVASTTSVGVECNTIINGLGWIAGAAIGRNLSQPRLVILAL